MENVADIDKKIEELQEEYRKAVYKESSIREAAFLGITLDIGGVEVKQFTPYHFILLDFLASPFLTGQRAPNETDIIDFLWVVSVKFKTCDPEAKKQFIHEIAEKVDYETAVVGIMDYVNEAFLDTPASMVKTEGAAKKIPYYAWICSYIDNLCSQYHWLDETVIHMPFARIFQYMKAIEARKTLEIGKEPVLFNNMSDKVANKIRAAIKEKKEKSNG